ncbi:MAG: hypothetical protein V1787_00085 [Candidatus Micrarchaeota archaeon]
MDWKRQFTGRHALFTVLFAVVVLAADQIKVFDVLGAQGQYFTLFQFFGPIAGGILGPVLGVAAVLLSQSASFVVLGKDATLLNLFRLMPMLFAAYYFASYKNKASTATWLVPVAAIALFAVHPVGQQAWFFTAFWLIPLAAIALPENLLLRSLGSSFTAHAVGSVVWLYALPSTAAFWTALIPVVVMERLLFAGGISASFVAANTLLSKFEQWLPSDIIAVDYRYVLGAQPTGAAAENRRR